LKRRVIVCQIYLLSQYHSNIAFSLQLTNQRGASPGQSEVDSMGEVWGGCPLPSVGKGLGIQSKVYQYAPQRLNPRNTLGKKWGGRSTPVSTPVYPVATPLQQTLRSVRA